VVLKLDVAVIAASIMGAVLWIEHGHRIEIETSTGAAFAAPVAAVCPDNDNVPYSTDCIVFMQGSVAAGRHWRVHAPERTPDAAGAVELAAPACPANNENVPYSANCIRFMSGWFWQANAAEPPAAMSVVAPK
jgi:hypothetical protein